MGFSCFNERTGGYHSGYTGCWPTVLKKSKDIPFWTTRQLFEIFFFQKQSQGLNYFMEFFYLKKTWKQELF